ncbi:MAG: tRNA (adenosine(37)-N6)-threonylcarbamoyltransferase complex dimerization subunit type 1 TsaB [Armatimonadota bacterium]|nr:tRNA (adenosine(37)-N6)-threonylcarbamoyltransferase complex dimerization subunit type 1 TsaB [Armatimonadota bacterium]
MKILTLDTTTDTSSIAVADEDGLLAEYNFAHKMDLSRRLMPNVVSMLKDCGLKIKHINGIGVSLGPGSFTGLRIGVVTAKTLAQALNIPIVGITTLDLLAYQFDYLPNAIVCPLIKVRKGEVYWAFFHICNKKIEPITNYSAGPIDEVIVAAKSLFEDQKIECNKQKSEIIFCGDGMKEAMETLIKSLGDLVIPASDWLLYPKASILARLTAEKIAAGETSDPLSLVPFYIRRSAPEMRIEHESHHS